MKYLNDKAVADAMLAKQPKEVANSAFEKAVQEALAARAKNITE
jgi:hypothetical protein